MYVCGACIGKWLALLVVIRPEPLLSRGSATHCTYCTPNLLLTVPQSGNASHGNSFPLVFHAAKHEKRTTGKAGVNADRGMIRFDAHGRTSRIVR